jgi:hypothetical protein
VATATIFEVSDVIKVSLIDNFSALDRWLMVIEKDQMPYAIARALTDMAQLGKATITHDIPTIFGKGGPPKDFTINSVVAKPATKETLAAEIFIKDKQAKYLQLEETGGTRSPKGAALVLPGSEAPDLHDVHGNLPEGLLRKLRAAVKQTKRGGKQSRRARAALTRASRKAGGGAVVSLPDGHQERDSGIVYFSQHGPQGRGTGGYYERMPGDKLRRLTGFEATEEFKPIFHYHERLVAVITPAFAPALMRRLQEAIGSRR